MEPRTTVAASRN